MLDEMGALSLLEGTGFMEEDAALAKELVTAWTLGFFFAKEGKGFDLESLRGLPV